MLIRVFQDVYRSAEPSKNLPFSVLSVGHYRIKPPCVSCDKTLRSLQLFWCVRGADVIQFGRCKYTLKKNQVALYYPGMRHYWYADRPEEWEFHWFTFDGPLAVSIPAVFGLEPGIYEAGRVPAVLFHKLRQFVGQPSKQAELQACVTAFSILARAANSYRNQTDEVINKAIEILHQQHMSPKLNIKTLVNSLKMRRATFASRFYAAMGMTPAAYLARLRTQKALALLQNTHLSISDIAVQCGYRDNAYFSRVIRRITGYAPLKFRKYSVCKTD
jgi:AraC-like DNA-binding protein